MQAQTVGASIVVAKPNEPLFQRIWPPAGIGFGLGLTAAWVAFLGYGLVSLIGL